MKGRKDPKGTFNRTAEVKPRGSEARADVHPSMEIFESPMFGENLMEEVCRRENLEKALKRVETNKGKHGVDGIGTEQLRKHLIEHWPNIRYQLLQGKYVPQIIRRVEIPKPGGKENRKLGIPTCTDRLIQQALLQILQRKWDGRFSDNSFGFRPGRSCHQAVDRAQSYIRNGYAIVIDIDLSKFFDRVNHDRLISKLQAEIKDPRVIGLIRGFLKAGILDEGLISVPTEGTAQGGPLSPFLSNIVLDELDQELASRNLKFVRYADDFGIYVKSHRAGVRVKESITRFIENRLRLKINEAKSAVDRPQNRKFLGFSFTGGRQPNRTKVSKESIATFRAKVRNLTRRNSGISMESRIIKLNYYLRGWKGYYGHAEAKSTFKELDPWIRRRLRSIQWKEWKVYKCRKQELERLGASPDQAQTCAWSPKGYWRMSQVPGVRKAMCNKYFDRLGLYRLDS